MWVPAKIRKAYLHCNVGVKLSERSVSSTIMEPLIRDYLVRKIVHGGLYLQLFVTRDISSRQMIVVEAGNGWHKRRSTG